MWCMDPEPEYDLVTECKGGQQIQEQQDYENITAQPSAPTLKETSGRVED